MRVLFVTSQAEDYLSIALWDGLQQLLGEENVVDAVGCPRLHWSTAVKLGGADGELDSRPVMRVVGASREGESLFVAGHYKTPFDLMVLNACFNRDHDWEWARSYAKNYLCPGGKVAYVEGWDAARQIHYPEMHVDAVFRKEIDRGPYAYNRPMHHLTFALPERMFVESAAGDRPCDVFWSGNPDACLPGREVRWPMLREVWRTRRHHRSVIATRGMGFDQYYGWLRRSKLALCPSGADLTDSLRTYEAVACGAVPVFVGYPDHVRDPWFPGDTCFSCEVGTLADHLDEALGHDLAPRREALLAHARKYHTTKYRAETLLRRVGLL